MTGLFLLLVMAIWFGIVCLLAVAIARFFSRSWLRWFAGGLVFVLVLPLPLADEIVGGRQFAALCRANSSMQVDRRAAAGKTVYPADAEWVKVPGTWVPIDVMPIRYVDAGTGETVISFNEFTASGGWLSHRLGLSESRAPFTFDGWCSPGDQGAARKLFKELSITPIPRPETNNGKSK
jgi:hypothetical protein